MIKKQTNIEQVYTDDDLQPSQFVFEADFVQEDDEAHLIMKKNYKFSQGITRPKSNIETEHKK